MAFFEDVIGKLFGQEQSDAPLISEPLKRSESFMEDYQRWVNSYKRKDLLNHFHTAYVLIEKGERSEHLLQLSTSRSNGLLFYNSDSHDQPDFEFFFEWLGQQVKQLGYKKMNADTTTSERKGSIETIDRYYLKPKTDFKNAPINQKFGNVLIELFKENGVNSRIKLLANNYSDRNYQKHYEFEFLAESLLTAK